MKCDEKVKKIQKNSISVPINLRMDINKTQTMTKDMELQISILKVSLSLTNFIPYKHKSQREKRLLNNKALLFADSHKFSLRKDCKTFPYLIARIWIFFVSSSSSSDNEEGKESHFSWLSLLFLSANFSSFSHFSF